jgi:hypothetical protein
MIKTTTLVNCDFCNNVIELSWTCLPTQADILGNLGRLKWTAVQDQGCTEPRVLYFCPDC